METATLTLTEDAPKQTISLKNLIFMGVAVLSFSLKVIYDWDKLIQFSPDVLGGLFLEIAPIIIIQLLALISKRKDISLHLSKKLCSSSKTKIITNNVMEDETVVIFANDIKFRFLAMVLVAFVIAVFYNSKAFLVLSNDFFIGFLISFLNTLFIWEGIHKFTQTLLKYYPTYQQTRKRLLIQSVSVVFYAFVVTLAISSFSTTFLIIGEKHSLWTNFGIALVPTVIISWIYETVFLFKSWKLNSQKIEQINKNKEVLSFW